jgi:hypothetical protein
VYRFRTERIILNSIAACQKSLDDEYRLCSPVSQFRHHKTNNIHSLSSERSSYSVDNILINEKENSTSVLTAGTVHTSNKACLNVSSDLSEQLADPCVIQGDLQRLYEVAQNSINKSAVTDNASVRICSLVSSELAEKAVPVGSSVISDGSQQPGEDVENCTDKSSTVEADAGRKTDRRNLPGKAVSTVANVIPDGSHQPVDVENCSEVINKGGRCHWKY